MFIKHNYLRWYRRKSRLTQDDLIFLLDLKDKSMVSRWEQGKRLPDIYNLLAYHLLFEIPIEILFNRQRTSLMEHIRNRVNLRMAFLKSNRPNGQALKRIEFMSQILTKLMPLAPNP